MGSGGGIVCLGMFLYQKNAPKIEERNVKEEHAAATYGVPASFLLHESADGFVSLVDYRLRIPLWVAEHLTQESVDSTEGDRRQSRFHPEKGVPATFRATPNDYKNSGYSRGHLSPASNNKITQRAMNESFSLANIVPQEMSMNGCDWLRLERMVQRLVRRATPRETRWNDVYVVSGPLFLSRNHPLIHCIADDGVADVKTDERCGVVSYETIGDNRVAVPTHLYKIVLAEGPCDKEDDPDDSRPHRAIAAFVMPNRPIKNRRPLVSYQVPVEAVEKAAGSLFFPRLRDERERCADLCALIGGQQCMYGDDERSSHWRRLGMLKSAGSIEEADAALATAREHGLDPQWMEDMFRREHKRRVEFLKTNGRTRAGV